MAATIANVNRGKNSRVFNETDFMPREHEFPGPTRRQTGHEMVETFKQLVGVTKKEQRRHRHG